MFRSCLYCDLHCLNRVYPLGLPVKNTYLDFPPSAGGGNHIHAVWFQTPFLLNERYFKGKRMCIHDSSIGGLLLYIDHLCDRPPCGWNATMGPQAAGLGWDSLPWNWFHRSSRSSCILHFFFFNVRKSAHHSTLCSGVEGSLSSRWLGISENIAALQLFLLLTCKSHDVYSCFILFEHLYVPVWKNTCLVCELNFWLLKSECSIRSHWVSHDQ